MSKHAVEAFTDSFAPEMEPAGVRVSAVEPGNYSSQIINNAAERMCITPRLNERPSRHRAGRRGRRFRPRVVRAETEASLSGRAERAQARGRSKSRSRSWSS